MAIFGMLKTADRVALIPLERLTSNRAQPRRTFCQDDLEELAESIRNHGILQPLSVRPDDRMPGMFEIVAGERRFRAAALAGLVEVPCLIVGVSDEEAAILAIMENLQRKDLSFMEEAAAIGALCVRFGLTQSQVAMQLGKAPSTVANKLRLLRLGGDEIAQLERNGLSERHARALIRLDDPVRRQRLLQQVIDRGLNVRQTEALVDRALGTHSVQTPVPSHPVRMIVVRDVRLFVNTINRAVEVMRGAGIDAFAQVEETDDCLCYTVKIPRSAAMKPPHGAVRRNA